MAAVHKQASQQYELPTKNLPGKDCFFKSEPGSVFNIYTSSYVN